MGALIKSALLAAGGMATTTSIADHAHRLTVTVLGAGASTAFALALLASGKLPLDALIAADDVPLAEIMPAMGRLAAGTAAAKLLVVPR